MKTIASMSQNELNSIRYMARNARLRSRVCWAVSLISFALWYWYRNVVVHPSLEEIDARRDPADIIFYLCCVWLISRIISRIRLSISNWDRLTELTLFLANEEGLALILEVISYHPNYGGGFPSRLVGTSGTTLRNLYVSLLASLPHISREAYFNKLTSFQRKVLFRLFVKHSLFADPRSIGGDGGRSINEFYVEVSIAIMDMLMVVKDKRYLSKIKQKSQKGVDWPPDPSSFSRQREMIRTKALECLSALSN